MKNQVIIKHCTITGADDSTSLKEMIEITDQFPFVEWGILKASPDRDGTPRYPSPDWIEDFERGNLVGALHLCGAAARAELGNFLPSRNHPTTPFRRIQYNLNGVMPTTTMYEWIHRRLQYDSRELIVPLNISNVDAWKLASETGVRKVSFLMDASGGRGKEIESFPILAGLFCGYAGGLGPGNILTMLDKLSKDLRTGITWIDMETNVRTGDNMALDMEKVHKVLSVVQEYRKDCNV